MVPGLKYKEGIAKESSLLHIAMYLSTYVIYTIEKHHRGIHLSNASIASYSAMPNLSYFTAMA